jgi:hypothetical protein
MKKLMAVLIILIFIGLALMPAINCEGNKVDREIEENKEPTSYIEASTSYDYGYKIGKRFRFQYKLLDIFTEVIKKSRARKDNIDNHIRILENNCPFFLDELKGLSASLNIKLERLIYLQSFIFSIFNHECTVTLATGKATKNNETFLTFNVDTKVGIGDTIGTIIHRIFALKCWIVRINTIRYKYAFWGIPVLYEFAFLNEKGLGWGSPGTRLTKNESRYIDEGPGISTMMLERLAMMTCKDVSEAAELYKNMERASQKEQGWFHMYDSSSSCFCDKNGDILIIEHTHNYIITVFGNSTDVTGARADILWHANHHQWLDPKLTGSIYPNEYPSSGLRAERAFELLNDSYGNITLETCMSITRDHGGGFDKNGKDSGDICRHPDKESNRITAYSWIILPKDLTVYWTYRSPCKSIFWKHDFSKRFGK